MPVIQNGKTEVKLRMYWVGITFEDAISRPSFPTHNHAKFEQMYGSLMRHSSTVFQWLCR